MFSTKKEVLAHYKKLHGRKIVRVIPNAFQADEHRGAHNRRRLGWTSDPVIVFDDGSELRVHVNETEVGEYGVTLTLHERD